jgi:hypothetical protein
MIYSIDGLVKSAIDTFKSVPVTMTETVEGLTDR